jgi:hypothetical protein
MISLQSAAVPMGGADHLGTQPSTPLRKPIKAAREQKFCSIRSFPSEPLCSM